MGLCQCFIGWLVGLYRPPPLGEFAPAQHFAVDRVTEQLHRLLVRNAYLLHCERWRATPNWRQKRLQKATQVPQTPRLQSEFGRSCNTTATGYAVEHRLRHTYVQGSLR